MSWISRRSSRAAVGAALGTAALLLGACESIENAFVRRSPGERLYRRLCAECHGINGNGNTLAGIGNPLNDLTDDTWKYGGDPGSMEMIVREGVLGSMPAHPELTDGEIRQIVDHVLSLSGHSRGPS